MKMEEILKNIVKTNDIYRMLKSVQDFIVCFTNPTVECEGICIKYLEYNGNRLWPNTNSFIMKIPVDDIYSRIYNFSKNKDLEILYKHGCTEQSWNILKNEMQKIGLEKIFRMKDMPKDYKYKATIKKPENITGDIPDIHYYTNDNADSLFVVWRGIDSFCLEFSRRPSFDNILFGMYLNDIQNITNGSWESYEDTNGTVYWADVSDAPHIHDKIEKVYGSLSEFHRVRLDTFIDIEKYFTYGRGTSEELTSFTAEMDVKKFVDKLEKRFSDLCSVPSSFLSDDGKNAINFLGNLIEKLIHCSESEQFLIIKNIYDAGIISEESKSWFDSLYMEHIYHLDYENFMEESVSENLV
ncbi:hypothetical protein [Eubacterium sp.]|uniref:hypothetical protein n=1 Tax=Eubacterium sp. TaxID=142586 RepID=UPI002FC5C6C8